MLPYPALHPFATIRNVGRIRQRVGLQQVPGVELAEELNDIPLGGRFVTKASIQGFPYLLHGTLAVQQPEDRLGTGTQPIITGSGTVLQHIPGLASVAVAVYGGMGSQAGLQPGDTIPQGV